MRSKHMFLIRRQIMLLLEARISIMLMMAICNFDHNKSLHEPQPPPPVDVDIVVVRGIPLARSQGSAVVRVQPGHQLLCCWHGYWLQDLQYVALSGEGTERVLLAATAAETTRSSRYTTWTIRRC